MIRKILCLLSIFTTNLTFSQEIPEEELERLEKESSIKVSEANSLDRSYGYYKKTRDEFYYGPHGIQTRLETFFQGSIAWINNWSSVLAVVDLGSSTLNQVISKIEEKMDEQSKDLYNLKNEALDILSKSQRAQSLLQKGMTIKAGQLHEYSDYVTIALNNANTLKTSIASIHDKAASKIDDMEYINTLSYEAVIGKLKVELINSGKYPVEESLARFNELMSVEQVSAPYRSSIFEKVNKLNSYTLDFAYFQAKEAWTHAKSECSSAMEALEGYESSFAQAARNHITTLCNTADQHWHGMNDMGLSIAEMVYEYAFLVGAELEANCQSQSPKISCESFAILQSISFESLAAMSEDRLAFYENQWALLAAQL